MTAGTPGREALAIEVMNVRRRIHGLDDLDLATLRRIKRDAGINEAFAIADAILARLAAKPADEGMRRPRAFLNWAADIFGPIARDRRERLTRFTEEALELAHAERLPISLLESLIDRVWANPRGETAKEIGQVQACLETFAESIGVSADAEASREFERVRDIPKDAWTRRHQAKVALGIANNLDPPDNSLTNPSTMGEVE